MEADGGPSVNTHTNSSQRQKVVGAKWWKRPSEKSANAERKYTMRIVTVLRGP